MKIILFCRSCNEIKMLPHIDIVHILLKGLDYKKIKEIFCRQIHKLFRFEMSKIKEDLKMWGQIYVLQY